GDLAAAKSELDRKQEAASVADGAPATDAAAPPAPSNNYLSSGAVSDTEAIYVIAAPSQVDATVAAIAGSAEYRNVQLTELTGQLPAELYGRMRATTFDDASAHG